MSFEWWYQGALETIRAKGFREEELCVVNVTGV
jgi:hypothetical protein